MSNLNLKYANVTKTIQEVTGNPLEKRIDEANSTQNELFFYIVQSPIKTEINEQGMNIPSINIDIRTCKKGETPILAEGEVIVYP